MRSVAVLGVLMCLLLPAAAATDASDDPYGAAPAETANSPVTGTVDAVASGPEVANLLRTHDLFGTFARDCGRPPAPDNPHVQVSQESGGVVIERHEFGPELADNVYSVRAVRRLSSGRLEFKVVFVPGSMNEEFQTLELLVGKDTRRTIFNRVDNGPVRVRRGVAVANGKKTPLLRKCS